eukprot:PhF_6_TR20811/c0_g1_i1/m.29939/K14299/SEH1; nucleoporin SEH1
MSKKLLAEHSAYVHQVAVDTTGRHIALCSTDKSVKIFERARPTAHPTLTTANSISPLGTPSNVTTGLIPPTAAPPLNTTTEPATAQQQSSGAGWVLAASFEEHTAVVNAVSWANPKFGALLASCSADRTIRFYKEQNVTEGSKWTSLANKKIHDTRADVFYDVAFCPSNQHPLKIAAANGDGSVRVYSLDDDGTWAEFCRFTPAGPSVSVFSLCWSTAHGGANSSALVVASEDGSVTVWSPNEVTNTFRCVPITPPIHHVNPVKDVAWGPYLGRRYHTIASCSSGGLEGTRINTLYPVLSEDGLEVVEYRNYEAVLEAHEGGGTGCMKTPTVTPVSDVIQYTSADFNKIGTTLAVIGSDNKVRIFSRDEWCDSPIQRWSLTSVLPLEDIPK